MTTTVACVLGVGALLGAAVSAQGEPLKVGDPVPAVKSVDQEGQPIELSQVLSRGLTLVYFYPKASTPGCTAQACGLRDHDAEVRAAGIRVIGVSTDRPQSQKKFKEKQQLPFTLLADESGEVLKAFGVSNLMGFAARQSFLVRDGVVVWRDLKAKTGSHAEDVLAAVAALGDARPKVP
jgi:peroxiredoxin Q/BCP